MIVVIEGFDGSGKDSVADAIGKYLGASRLNFPDRTSGTGKVIDAYLKREWTVCGRMTDGVVADQHKAALALQSLCLANRLEHYETLLQAAGDRDNHLVVGRYWPSGWVYGQLDGLDRAWIELTNKFFPDPDLCVLLDASAETCLERRSKRDGTTIAPERYEGKLETGRRAVALYQELWNEVKGWDDTWLVVNAEQPLDNVIHDVEMGTDGAL